MSSPSVPAQPHRQQQQQMSLLPVGAVCEITDEKTGTPCLVTVLSRRFGSSSNPTDGSNTDDVQYYIHRHDQDKRMDGWVDQTSIRLAASKSGISAALISAPDHPTTPIKGTNGSTTPSNPSQHSVEKGKRKAEHDLVYEGSDGSRTPSASRQASPALIDRADHRGRHQGSAGSSETPAMRNIDRVLYGNFDIKTWYYSPYPLDDEDATSAQPASHGGASAGANKRLQSPSLLRHGSTGKGIARKGSSSGLGGALSASARDAPAIKSLASSGADSPMPSTRQSPSSVSSGNARSKKGIIPTKLLWICDGCFKYMQTYNGFAAHRKFCRDTHPPGRKVYQRGAHIIWEVDGAAEKLYCQNLSLFGKLFIDHKTIYFDVEPFMFYVLTDAANASFDHPLGFFSKEKVSYDDYNLACIVTFPPFQRKSFGTLMIEFSYYLSAAQGMLGTPERPLSDLGFKGYLSFWTAVLLRSLICCFDGPLRPAASSTSRQRRPSSPVKPTDAALVASSNVMDAKGKAEDALRRWQVLSQRCKLLSVPIESISHQDGFAELQQLASEANSSETVASSTSGANASAKRRLRLKGWAGSMPNRNPRDFGNGTEAEGSARRSTRATNGTSSASGNISLHPALDISKLQQDGPCTMAVSVEALSQLTHLRPDDIVLALSEAGLATAPNTPFLSTLDEAVSTFAVPADESDDKVEVRREEPNGKHASAKPPLALLLTRDAIREAIERFNIRPAVLDESYALI